MKTLGIDLETYSSESIEAGAYRYSKSPDFSILLFGYSIDKAPAIVVDLFNLETIPAEVMAAIEDPAVIKTAYNAAFELIALSEWLSRKRKRAVVLDPSQWRCTMVLAAMCGLPGRLGDVGKVLNLDTQKMKAGKSLITYFGIPCKPTKVNGQRTRNLPEHAPEKWEMFKQYNAVDVDSENEIISYLSFYDVPTFEHKLWVLDQKINRRGICMDSQLVINALAINEFNKAELLARAVALTGLDNPNSLAQLKAWLSEATGKEVTTLTKKTAGPMLKALKSDSDAAEVMRIRSELGKTSNTKYEAMRNAWVQDEHGNYIIRWLLQYYGANRTGRWAGRIVQVQNLPKNKTKALGAARSIVKAGKIDALRSVFDNIPNTLSELIRVAFIPRPGKKFFVSDFAAIEARVISWLANEAWRLEIFATHGAIYEAAASKMFGIDYDTIVEGHENYKYRDYGKVSELALGFQGAEGALITMGALEMGVPEDMLSALVILWRRENHSIVRMWKGLENAVRDAVINPGRRVSSTRIYTNREEWDNYDLPYGVHAIVENNVLFIGLPSGRRLSYWAPEIELTDTDYGYQKKSVIYYGLDQKTKQWSRQSLYGGKITENIVQAVARDLLANALVILERRGFDCVMHVHDEAVLEVPENCSDLSLVTEIMCYEVDWAPGIPLAAKSFETMYYKKD